MDNARFTYLFNKYTAKTCTVEEREEFFELVKLHQDDEQLAGMLDALYTDTRVVRISHTWKWAAAAAVAALIIAGTWMFRTKPAYYQTANKEQQFITLSDSTKIWLNSGSTLHYPKSFDKGKREIYLEGEAYFDVRHAASWPFIIHSPGGITTTVLGTAFNIKAYPGRKMVIVSVVEGKVRISRESKEISTLVKGQELRLAVNTTEQHEVEVAPLQVAAWHNGDYNFTDETLGDIIKDMQVYYGVSIRLDDTRLADLQLTTGFKKNTSVGNALAIICELANANYTIKDNVYVVY